MLTYADLCDVCWRMLTYAYIYSGVTRLRTIGRALPPFILRFCIRVLMLSVIGWRAVDLQETYIFVMWVCFSSERFSSAKKKRKIRDKRKIILLVLDYHKFLNLFVCIFVFLCVSLNFYDASVALHCQGVYHLSPGGQTRPWTHKFVPMGFVWHTPIRQVKSVLPLECVDMEDDTTSSWSCFCKQFCLQLWLRTRVNVSLKSFTCKFEKVQHLVTVTTLSYTTLTIR